MPYDFEEARDSQGQIRIMGIIVRKCCASPPVCLTLLKLARDCRFAARRLADFLDTFAGTMADRLVPIEQDTVGAL